MITQSIENFIKQGYNVKIDRHPQLLSNVAPVNKIRSSAKHQTPDTNQFLEQDIKDS